MRLLFLALPACVATAPAVHLPATASHESAHPSFGCRAPQPIVQGTRTLSSGGRTRRFRLVVPESARQGPAPLVLNIHGLVETPERHERDGEALARVHGLVGKAAPLRSGHGGAHQHERIRDATFRPGNRSDRGQGGSHGRVIVDDRPGRPRGSGYDSDDDLLGLYEGINRLDRAGDYHLVTPDRITLFWRSIVDEVGSGDGAAIRREVRKTVIHEVAHHFGMDDAELERLGG